MRRTAAATTTGNNDPQAATVTAKVRKPDASSETNMLEPGTSQCNLRLLFLSSKCHDDLATRGTLTRTTRKSAGTSDGRARAESTVEASEELEAPAIESDASNSADEYAPEEDDEAYSEEDELDDPLSEDLEELEAQLREEVSRMSQLPSFLMMMTCLPSTTQAPVWTKEKDDKLPPVLRRKKAKKEVGFMLDLEGEIQRFNSGVDDL